MKDEDAVIRDADEINPCNKRFNKYFVMVIPSCEQKNYLNNKRMKDFILLPFNHLSLYSI